MLVVRTVPTLRHVRQRGVGGALTDAVGLVNASVLYQRRIRTLLVDLEARDNAEINGDSDGSEEVNQMVQASMLSCDNTHGLLYR